MWLAHQAPPRSPPGTSLQTSAPAAAIAWKRLDQDPLPLGICLGLQILFETSEEAPGAAGFGWFKGAVKKLVGDTSIKIPHMGWNSLELTSGGHPLLEAAGGANTYVYFVHSFHAAATEAGVVKATVQHGHNVITAAVSRDNVMATQFHPEKSQAAGIALLRRFLTS